MNINIEIIPHETHRYPTVGDWWFDEQGNIQIRVSKLSDWRREALIAVHELAEVLMCKHDGVSQESVDEFDKQFEAKREAGELTDEYAEPGDSSDAPYVKQHCVATGIERVLAAELGVKWREYERELEELP